MTQPPSKSRNLTRVQSLMSRGAFLPCNIFFNLILYWHCPLTVCFPPWLYHSVRLAFSVCLSVCLCVCLSVSRSLFLCLSLSLFLSLSLYFSLCSSPLLNLFLSFYLPTYLYKLFHLTATLRL